VDEIRGQVVQDGLHPAAAAALVIELVWVPQALFLGSQILVDAQKRIPHLLLAGIRIALAGTVQTLGCTLAGHLVYQ